MYIRSLSIQNLRSFESAELSLCYPEDGSPPAAGGVPHLGNITLLLGSNGAGKTTVLRAAALSTLAPVLAMGSGYVPYALVRRVKGGRPAEAHVKAHVILHEQDDLGAVKEEDIEATLMAPPRGYTDRFVIEKQPPSWHVRLYDEDSAAFLVLGYGATRRIETGPGTVESRARERILRYRRVAGLFEEHVTLMPLSAWMPQVARKDKRRHQEIVSLMNQLLPEMKMLGKWEDKEEPESLFQRGGSILPFPALSDGYRAFICWVGDVLYHLHSICPKNQRLVDMRGVVLVDEVDLHLHPEWQRHLVPTLSSALPRLQFILTSHSPLVVGTLSSRNVLLLEEREYPKGVRSTQVLSPGEELYGMSADQILTSSSFGLESSRDEHFFEQLKDVAEKAREGGAEAALRFMRMVAGGGAAEDSNPIRINHKPMVLKGHEGVVWDVAWASTSNKLASASDDATVQIWDSESGRRLAVLQGHEDEVIGLAWEHVSDRLASASADKTLRIWDTTTGSELLVLVGHRNGVNSVAWDQTKNLLASASQDMTLRIWNATTGKPLAVLRGHEAGVVGVAWDPTGTQLASASLDETLRVWSSSAGNEIKVLKGHHGAVCRVAWDALGQRLASASMDGTVRVWDTKTGATLAIFNGHKDGVMGLSWDVSGRWLASASMDKTVRVWDTKTGEEAAIFRGHRNGVTGVAWDALGQRLASASMDETVRTWEFESQQERVPQQTTETAHAHIKKPSTHAEPRGRRNRK